jgi:NAD(P)-dependent dehydrogenase (short-subunit alcohol dehydrogenase family)
MTTAPHASACPVALITGADHSPGRETAFALARAGFKVWAFVPSSEDAALLSGTAPRDAAIMPVVVDATDPRDRSRALADIADIDGRLDAIILDVATTLEGPLALLSDGEVLSLLDRNVLAPFALVRDTLRLLQAAPAARVIAFSPLSGDLAIPGMGAASAARFALEALFTAWRTELSHHRVAFTLLETGPVRSEPARPASLSARASAEARDDGPWRPFIVRFLALRLAMMTRAIAPDEVATALVDLATRATPPHHLALGGPTRARRLLQTLLPSGTVHRLVGAILTSGAPDPAPREPVVSPSPRPPHPPARHLPRWGPRPSGSAKT